MSLHEMPTTIHTVLMNAMYALSLNGAPLHPPHPRTKTSLQCLTHRARVCHIVRRISFPLKSLPPHLCNHTDGNKRFFVDLLNDAL
jgi:hypothetical protein